MRMEDLRDAFPKMPADMRAMVESEVQKQMRTAELDFSEEKVTETGHIGRKRISWKKALIVGLAATLTVGSTVFAGVNWYRIHSEKVGSYGLETGIQAENTENAESDGYGTAPEEIPVVTIKANYIPEGMVSPDNEPEKMFYKDTPYQGGISMFTIVMVEDATKEQLSRLDTDVVHSEELNINGHDAIYLEKQMSESGSVDFDKKFYVVYPEVWHVLEVYVGQDMTKEEAIEVLKQTELTATGEVQDMADIYTWSDVIAAQEEEADAEGEPHLTVSQEDMAQTHAIGDTFSVGGSADIDGVEALETDAITASVTDVQVADNLSLLTDTAHIEQSWLDAVGEDGKLLSNEISYIKSGDGIDTLDEVVKTETVSQKLVYVTVKYTNTSEKQLSNVMFYATMPGIVQNGDTYTIYDRAKLDSDGSWDQVQYTGPGDTGEIYYYDVHGGERDNNYIPVMEPGESVEVHFAQIVNEDELPYLYLSLDLGGGAYEFSEGQLVQGYVDIRQ